MTTPTEDQNVLDKVSEITQHTFPHSKILSIHKLNVGQTSEIYKVHLTTAPSEVIIRFSRLKNFQKSIQILQYLKENLFPVPGIFHHSVWQERGISIIENIPGKTALEYFMNTTQEKRESVFHHLGQYLKQLHDLPVQDFWFRESYPISTSTDWYLWMGKRFKEVREYTHQSFDTETKAYIENILVHFEVIIETLKDQPVVPLHGDFHLENVLVNEKGDITGILDFDTALRGQFYGDVGRFLYSLLLHENDYQYNNDEFKAFLKGYYDEKAPQFHAIFGYFVLMLLEKHKIFTEQCNTKRLETHNRVLKKIATNKLTFG